MRKTSLLENCMKLIGYLLAGWVLQAGIWKVVFHFIIIVMGNQGKYIKLYSILLNLIQPKIEGIDYGPLPI